MVAMKLLFSPACCILLYCYTECASLVFDLLSEERMSDRYNALCAFGETCTAKGYTSVLGNEIVDIVSRKRDRGTRLKLTHDLRHLDTLAGLWVLNHSGGMERDNRPTVS